MKKLAYIILLLLASSCIATGRIPGDRDFIDDKTLGSIKNPIETKEIVYYEPSKFSTSKAAQRKLKRDAIVQDRLINFTKNTIELIFNEGELEKSRDKIKYSIEVEYFRFNEDLTLFQKFTQINILIPFIGELAKGVIKENPKPVELEVIRDEPKEYTTICDLVDCAEPTFYYYPRTTIENIQFYSLLASIASLTFAYTAPDHIWEKYQIGIVLNVDFFDLNDRPLKSIKISSEIDQGDKKYHNKTGFFRIYRDKLLYKIIMDINEQLRSQILGNKESFIPLSTED